MKADQMLIKMLQTFLRVHNTLLRYSKIWRKISNMLEDAWQSITGGYNTSQGFRTSHRRCAASQRVAGPYGRPYCMYLIVSGSDTCISQWSGIRGGMSAGVTWEHGNRDGISHREGDFQSYLERVFLNV